MSTDANKELVRRYLEEYVGGGDEAVADALVDEGIVFTSPTRRSRCAAARASGR